MSIGSHDMDFLKETLQSQQELLQKLYNELDVERESSAIAADEALSMILRLQGEKAAMEMEASQYKRIAEEKMCHAQETLEIFQELIYQKEMLIASLEFQVQAYRFKLTSIGCDDLGVCDMQYPENMLSRMNGFSGETSGQSSLKRGNSLPPQVLDAVSRRASTDGSKSSQSSPKNTKDFKDAESSIRKEHANDHNSYWDEIRKLEERVKELANIKSSNGVLTPATANAVSESSSVNLPISTLPICNPSPESSPTKSDFPEYSEKVLSVPASGDSPCSSSVQDIFEVPLCPDPTPDDSCHNKSKHKLVLEDEGKQRKIDSVWDEIWRSDVKEKIDWEKKPLLSPSSINDSPKPRDISEKLDAKKRPLPSPSKNNELKLKDAKSTEKQLLFKHPTYGVADFELQQFNRRLKQLEDERFVTRGHDNNVETTDHEELTLLREIWDKVDSMQAEITGWRNKKPPPKDSVGCLKEVMQCFWP